MRTTTQLELATTLEGLDPEAESVDSEPVPVVVRGVTDMEEFRRI